MGISNAELVKIRDSEILELKEQLLEALDKIDELEENDVGIHLSDTEKEMLQIISQQIGRLSESSKVELLDKDSTKLFDTYVKDFVAIRGKVPVAKKEEVGDTEQEISSKLSVLYGD